MAILCYQASETTVPNVLSTTGAEDGHVAALIKSDHAEATAQVYSELAANKLALFLGLPVAAGVPVRTASADSSIRFASLKAAEYSLNLYDFTLDEDCSPDNFDMPIKSGMHTNSGHIAALQEVCEKYPLETAQVAVFDLWIGNADRPFNFKAELRNDIRGVFFALDQGSSLLACAENTDKALEKLSTEAFPNFHVFQKIVHPVYCGSMLERIINMPDWAIFAATTFEDTIGNVTLDEQYAVAQSLLDRRAFLASMVNRILL